MMNKYMLISHMISSIHFMPPLNALFSGFLAPVSYSLVTPPPTRVPSGSYWRLELGLSVGQSSCQSHQDRPRGLRSRNSRLPPQRERYIVT